MKLIKQLDVTKKVRNTKTKMMLIFILPGQMKNTSELLE